MYRSSSDLKLRLYEWSIPLTTRHTDSHRQHLTSLFDKLSQLSKQLLVVTCECTIHCFHCAAASKIQQNNSITSMKALSCWCCARSHFFKLGREWGDILCDTQAIWWQIHSRHLSCFPHARHTVTYMWSLRWQADCCMGFHCFEEFQRAVI